MTETIPPVMRKALPTAKIDGGKHVARAEIQEVTMAVGVNAPLHLHPCPTMGVVIRGRIAYEIDGAATRHLGPGDAFYEPANVRIARFDNDGDIPARFVVFYLLGENETETVRIMDD